MKTFLIILLAAATAALTFIVRVPIPGTGGYLNIGDIAVIFCGLFLGKKYGAIAGGVGSALADLIGGFFIFAPITLVAKGLEGFLAGLIGDMKVGGEKLGAVSSRRFSEGFAGKKKVVMFLLPVAGLAMVSTYFKRYRMEADLAKRDFSKVAVPLGYRLFAWDPELLEAHAEAKFLSFCDEIDANVFPCLGSPEGCLRLMHEIAAKPGFLPEATWLAAYDNPQTGQLDYCGTIQGRDTQEGYGSIQNLGVVPKHRGRGLATCLLVRALAGFQKAGLRRVSLEVTAENRAAIQLYRDQQFKVVKTVFKAAQATYP